MRCPACQTENADEALSCHRCRHRLFAWLGDPFGNLEPPGQPPAAETRAPAGSRWEKVAVASLLVVLLLIVSPGSAVVTAAVLAVVVRRWPAIGWGAFNVLLGAMLVAAWVLPPIPPLWSPARSPAPVPTRPPAVATATAQAQATARAIAAPTATARAAATATARAVPSPTPTQQPQVKPTR